MNHAEDRRRRADAQRERHDGGGGEGRIASHHACGIAKVHEQVSDRTAAARVAAVFLEPLDPAEIHEGLPLGANFGTLVVLARDERPGAGSAGLVERTRHLDARLVALQSGPVDRLVAESLGQRRALQIVSATIGAGSLLMVAVGVWGLSHSTFRRRWREFGIRLALGSTPGEVGRLALRDAWIVAGVGGAGGLLAAWQFGRVLRGWLFGVTPHDPGVLAAATAVVIAAVLAGGLGPARQAARADPAALLRD